MVNENRPVLIDAARVTRLLALIAAFVVLLSVVGQLMRFLGGHENIYGLIRLFSVTEEGNIPTFFSTFLLLFASLLLAIIATGAKRAKAEYAGHWAILSLIFLCLACDEAASIHELFARPVQELDFTHSPLLHGWVVPGLLGATVFTFCYLRFWRHLPPKTKSSVLLAGVIYVGGALGMEMIESYYGDRFGYINWSYELIATVQESLEMAGVIIFIFALLGFLENNYRDLRLRFSALK